MSSFIQYVERHGEFIVQSLVDQMERAQGIRYSAPIPLEDRWNIVMAMPVNNACYISVAA